ncbi:hypothetical protein SVIO_105830 [Streptomyces violaceusniger]|uniref:Uncharacterized protein n=1 Tax=Streptomyces violaceusniger TaxID=68280 RepID=A0A4D4LL46_STRVO|nr:hypothetical protein SVIO_105830 [Streptomyces violaceusniger]
MRGVEHVKRYTSLGTANDQGKTSGVNAIGVIAEVLGTGSSPGEIGTTAYRAPYTPVAFAALAGRERGELSDPERMTSLHSWHVAHGAESEDVGQWKRPWYYPRPGEDMDTAVARECRAAREGWPSWTPPPSARSRSGAGTPGSSWAASTRTASRSCGPAWPATA